MVFSTLSFGQQNLYMIFTPRSTPKGLRGHMFRGDKSRRLLKPCANDLLQSFKDKLGTKKGLSNKLLGAHK